MNAADTLAMKKLLAVAPAWNRVTRAGDAIGLADRTLLHCGPPADPPNDLVIPIRNSAAVACVFEGWAKTLDEATELVASGDVAFVAAQDCKVVTPMAAVVSPSMKLLEFVDLNEPSRHTWAPLNGGGTGADPVPRYGKKSQAALDFLRFLNDDVGEAIATAPAEPIPWLPIIDEALTLGDDGHLRHVEAHKILVDILRDRLGDEFAGSKIGAFVAKWPFFHLNYWMAASKLIVSAADGSKDSAIITAFGGNGKKFGLQVAGLPGRWFTVPATPPIGTIREPHSIETIVGACGDSAITEGLGLGALAQSYCPDMQALHKDFNPDDLLELPEKLLMAPHPGLPKSRARVGLSARAVVDLQTTPVLELGIADKAGIDGGLGAGLYRPPMDLFTAACAALD
jgi:hypothetical protein